MTKKFRSFLSIECPFYGGWILVCDMFVDGMVNIFIFMNYSPWYKLNLNNKQMTKPLCKLENKKKGKI